MSAPTLTTARLFLRPCGRGDVDWLHALWTDPIVRRYLWDDVVIDRARAEKEVAESGRSFARRGFGLWIVERRESRAPAGFAGLRTASWEDAPEILYGLLPSLFGQGLAAEAAAAVLAHAFEALGLPRVIAATNPPNVRSVRLLERLGMRLERTGNLDGFETLFYSIARERLRKSPLHRGADRAGYAGGVEQPGSSSGS